MKLAKMLELNIFSRADVQCEVLLYNNETPIPDTVKHKHFLFYFRLVCSFQQHTRTLTVVVFSDAKFSHILRNNTPHNYGTIVFADSLPQPPTSIPIASETPISTTSSVAMRTASTTTSTTPMVESSTSPTAPPIIWIQSHPTWASFPILMYIVHLSIGENGQISGTTTTKEGTWEISDVFEETTKVLPGLSQLCKVELIPYSKISKVDEDPIYEVECNFNPKVQPPRLGSDLDLPLSANSKEVYGFFPFLFIV